MADQEEPATLPPHPHWSCRHARCDLVRREPMPIHALTGWGHHNELPDSKWERRGGSSLFGYTIRFGGRAPQCFKIETLHSIDSSGDIVLGNVGSQELR